ncbi:hypothetical protein ACVC7V_07765 [Hydrogenophaga sp. A37]|uniref:hypothetical protein n=1 Tax=Hydrogenophaga sp. A37 TaxID=1945864 RepID=UPI00117AB8F5|nr:hypothetical protein [Hydrogenophaga sp. A37]
MKPSTANPPKAFQVQTLSLAAGRWVRGGTIRSCATLRAWSSTLSRSAGPGRASSWALASR